VMNADEVTFSGRKEEQKLYRHHTGFKGGLKEIPVRRVRARHPARLLRLAVRGMLPKNRVRHAREERLLLLTGGEQRNPHHGQVAASPWQLVGGSSSVLRQQQQPSVAGFFVALEDEEAALRVSARAHAPAPAQRALALRARKAALHKQLKVGKEAFVFWCHCCHCGVFILLSSVYLRHSVVIIACSSFLCSL
jgi:hypothetical protein